MIKLVSLFILVLQNSSLVLIMKYSKSLNDYSSSMVVLMAEMLKLIVSSLLFVVEITLSNGNLSIGMLKSQLIEMIVPAALYLLQNNLQFRAVELLDPATFQVLHQMKIITTALFTVLLLKRNLNIRQWMSLLLLALGVSIVQISNISYKVDHTSNQMLGFFLITIVCLLSGIAGVWYLFLLILS